VNDFRDKAFDDPDMLLAGLIADVEQDKGRVQVRYETLKETYHAGQWRSLGFTKRQIEDRMTRISGEVLGFKGALSVLYRAVNARGESGQS
jgi:hypothetical protein